jgi:nucleoside-diphosphate kinase
VDRLREKLLNAFLWSHHGVISRAQALELGVSLDAIDWSVRSGRWVCLHRDVYGRAGETVGPETQLLTAGLAAGHTAVSSHGPAAWRWRSVDSAPERPSVAAAHGGSRRITGVDLHGRDDVDAAPFIVPGGTTVTDPLRALAAGGEVGTGCGAGNLAAVMERTLVICKPDAVERRLVGEIVARLERKGLRLAAAELRHLDKETAMVHYGEHQGKVFFDDLITFITRSPVMLLAVEGPADTWKVVRTLMGVTNPLDAAPGTIRGDLGLATTENLVHGSDGPESAAREIALFFPHLAD